MEEIYTNDGHGTVLTDKSAADAAEGLFKQQARWTCKDLNAQLGWQFSQAVFSLRKRGFNIVTLKIAPRQYAYELREGSYIPRKRNITAINLENV